ncbi:ABC transporter [Salpingoeca rosetta]|uniref:ABC transporter n=1 Tax=Salpingoeca rosetta (strain ATCC 50818 / BSB-021) TaxID=946362 RepID=F2UNV9_SALR5|nr:ABC transporter [Salpingoeca rosetta]EGD79314.1 ABC transporter [Salpingoeca rosetta]|eukprot:XP_004989083.1 ABC transporter [Salpingoeca rosetta]
MASNSDGDSKHQQGAEVDEDAVPVTPRVTKYRTSIQCHPFDKSWLLHIFSLITFSWLGPTMQQGSKRQLDTEDMYALPSFDTAERCVSRLENMWDPKKKRSFWVACCLSEYAGLIFAGFIFVSESTVQVVGAYLLGQLTRVLEREEAGEAISDRTTYLYALGISLCALMNGTFHHICFFLAQRAGHCLRTATIALVYKKALKLSTKGAHDVTVGHMTNLVSNDVERFFLALPYIHFIWIGPVQTIVVAVLLWDLVGAYALCGIGLIVLLIPVNTITSRMYARFREKTAKQTDRRVRIMSEVSSTELLPSKGSAGVRGRVSYASQEPWILATTVRENILFGAADDPARRAAVIRACALERDLQLLPGGEQALIGERGVTLSGGQKARVSLARAVYRQADVYLLDDPLSAVDAKVGRVLFEECICGLLAGKTRVLATHQVHHLAKADLVVVLDANGRVAAQGVYSDLLAQKCEALMSELEAAQEDDDNNNDDDDDEDEDDDKDEEDAADGKGETSNVRSRAQSESKSRSRQVSESGGEGADESAESTDSNANALFKQEDRFAGQVTWSTYTTYFKHMGSTLFIIALLLSVPVVQALYIGVDLFLANWVDLEDSERNSSRQVGIYCGLLAALATGAMLRAIMFQLGFVEASRRLHDNMFAAVIASPIRFFDTNPVGRILNRFSKDTGYLDDILPPTYLDFIQLIGIILGTIILASAINPWVLLAAGPILVIFVLIRGYFLRTAREIKRLEAICRSPIYSHFSTSLAGLATIRSQGGGERAVHLLHNYQNTHAAAVYMFLAVSRWLGFRCDMACGCVYANVFGVCNMSMRYAEELPPALRHLSMVIPPAAKVGIVGRTGAGKSSILAALFRLSIVEGTINIDGVDVTKLPLSHVRRKISVIPQDPTLFSGTVRYNLDPFEQYSDADLWAALETVQLKEKVQQMDGGLEGHVQEQGSNFSVGQKQLICLARALLKRNKILVIDEATAHVDDATDRLIQHTLRREFKDCTVLTIAHRLHTIMDSDMIAVMDAGRLVEYDQPYALLQRSNSHLSRLVASVEADSHAALVNAAKRHHSIAIHDTPTATSIV